MSWHPLAEGVAYPFEIVCPDGFVRHYPYADEGDAQSDARHASERSCQFYDKPSRLEEAFGKCRGGTHRVRKREIS